MDDFLFGGAVQGAKGFGGGGGGLFRPSRFQRFLIVLPDGGIFFLPAAVNLEFFDS